MNIKKLIIPAAGIGSRFLPITKTIPKEMLPIGNKPAIEYIVQEASDAHIKNIEIILSPEKTSIKDYFQENKKLNQILTEKNELYRIKSIQTIIENINISFSYQSKPAGLADALMHAQNFIEHDQYFAVALPDDLIFGTSPELEHLILIAQKMSGMVIAVQEIPLESIGAYGVVVIDKKINDRCYAIQSMVEKPSPKDAPSNLAIVGRYIFHKDLFTYIPKTPLSKSGEILLPDTINLMIKQGYPVFAYIIQGQRFDTGTPQGWLHCLQTIQYL